MKKCRFFHDLYHQNFVTERLGSGTASRLAPWIRIRIELLGWIRIRLKRMRIWNTGRKRRFDLFLWRIARASRKQFKSNVYFFFIFLMKYSCDGCTGIWRLKNRLKTTQAMCKLKTVKSTLTSPDGTSVKRAKEPRPCRLRGRPRRAHPGPTEWRARPPRCRHLAMGNRV